MTAPRVFKRRRNTQPAVEHLDMRIAPTTVSVTAALAAELKVEGRQVHRLEAALTTTAPGSHREQVLSNRLARTEHRMGVQEVRLARIEARELARIQASPMFRIQGQPPTHPTPTPVNQPYSVMASTPAVTSSTPVFASSITTTNPVTVSTGTTTSTQSGGSSDTGSQSSLPPNASSVLGDIYDAYTQDPTNFLADLQSMGAASKVVIQGTNVGIQVKDNNPADFATLVSQLQAAGMQISSSSATYGLVVGMLPIAQLPAVAGLPEVPSVTAMFQPMVL
jgi:hypothetical protein